MVALQNVDASPGHAAELRPALLMYQLLHPAEKTVTDSSSSSPRTHLSSASASTSMVEA